jgi:hypothetical protein
MFSHRRSGRWIAGRGYVPQLRRNRRLSYVVRKIRELGVTRQTLYRHVGPGGEQAGVPFGAEGTPLSRARERVL